jgi:GT2 family glycosyltransferase
MSGDPTARRVIAYIPHHRGRGMLAAALTSLRAQSVEIGVLVVDNRSTDGSIAMVRSDFPEVEVCELGANQGFGRALNAAVRARPAELLLFLNNDVVCDPDFVAAMLDGLGRRTASVAGVLLQDGDANRIASAGVVVDRALGAYDYLFDEPVASARDAPAPHGPTGGAALIRLDAFSRVGGFDERIFAYLEDVDLALRLRCEGSECRLAPTATALHRQAGTLGLHSPHRFALTGFSRGYLLRRYGVMRDPRLAPHALARDLAACTAEALFERTTAGATARVRGWRAAAGLAPRPIPDDLLGLSIGGTLRLSSRWRRLRRGAH